MLENKQHIERLFKNSEKFSDKDGLLFIRKILEAIEKLDIELIKILKNDEKTKRQFFTVFEDVLILNQNKLIDFFTQNDYLKNGSYTSYTNKIGLIKKDSFIKKFDDVVLAFPHKDCVLEGGQTKDEDKKKEIFYNDILSRDEIDRLFEPKVLTNIKKYTKDGVELNPIIKDSDNLVIKGNNLIALHSLKKKFAGKVKLIYIDPPYNTGKDSFGYNDNFNHSTWLTFMKNRLEVARDFLHENGVIIVSIDDSEQAYLKVLMDEIFGFDEFQTSFFVQVRYGNKTLSEDNDYQKVMEIAHVYSKNSIVFKPNKLKEEYSLSKFKYKITELENGKIVEINGKKVEIFSSNQYKVEEIKGNIDGLKETWATGSLIRQGGTAAEFLSKYLIERKKEDGLNTLYKVYGMGEDGLGYRYISGPKQEAAFRGKFYSGVPLKIKNGVANGEFKKEKPIPNFMYNFLEYQGDFGNCRHEGGVNLNGGKKPEELIRSFIEYFTNERDIVMDYHLGSATTCAVAHKMNRQYIGMEQMNYIEDISVQRLKNVINGEQSGISKDINWNGGGDFIYAELKQIDNFKDCEIGALNKNMQYLPIGQIEDSIYDIKPEIININKAFYGIEDE